MFRGTTWLVAAAAVFWCAAAVTDVYAAPFGLSFLTGLLGAHHPALLAHWAQGPERQYTTSSLLSSFLVSAGSFVETRYEAALAAVDPHHDLVATHTTVHDDPGLLAARLRVWYRDVVINIGDKDAFPFIKPAGILFSRNSSDSQDAIIIHEFFNISESTTSILAPGEKIYSIDLLRDFEFGNGDKPAMFIYMLTEAIKSFSREVTLIHPEECIYVVRRLKPGFTTVRFIDYTLGLTVSTHCVIKSSRLISSERADSVVAEASQTLIDKLIRFHFEPLIKSTAKLILNNFDVKDNSHGKALTACASGIASERTLCSCASMFNNFVTTSISVSEKFISLADIDMAALTCRKGTGWSSIYRHPYWVYNFLSLWEFTDNDFFYTDDIIDPKNLPDLNEFTYHDQLISAMHHQEGTPYHIMKLILDADAPIVTSRVGLNDSVYIVRNGYSGKFSKRRETMQAIHDLAFSQENPLILAPIFSTMMKAVPVDYFVDPKMRKFIFRLPSNVRALIPFIIDESNVPLKAFISSILRLIKILNSFCDEADFSPLSANVFSDTKGNIIGLPYANIPSFLKHIKAPNGLHHIYLQARGAIQLDGASGMELYFDKKQNLPRLWRYVKYLFVDEREKSFIESLILLDMEKISASGVLNHPFLKSSRPLAPLLTPSHITFKTLLDVNAATYFEYFSQLHELDLRSIMETGKTITFLDNTRSAVAIVRTLEDKHTDLRVTSFDIGLIRSSLLNTVLSSCRTNQQELASISSTLAYNAVALVLDIEKPILIRSGMRFSDIIEMSLTFHKHGLLLIDTGMMIFSKKHYPHLSMAPSPEFPVKPLSPISSDHYQLVRSNFYARSRVAKPFMKRLAPCQEFLQLTTTLTWMTDLCLAILGKLELTYNTGHSLTPEKFFKLALEKAPQLVAEQPEAIVKVDNYEAFTKAVKITSEFFHIFDTRTKLTHSTIKIKNDISFV